MHFRLLCFLHSLLKTSHSPNLMIGVLEKERARRLIHNYNLIYNLSLSPQKIDQALQSFRAGENMLLEPALRYLKSYDNKPILWEQMFPLSPFLPRHVFLHSPSAVVEALSELRPAQIL